MTNMNIWLFNISVEIFKKTIVSKEIKNKMFLKEVKMDEDIQNFSEDEDDFLDDVDSLDLDN